MSAWEAQVEALQTGRRVVSAEPDPSKILEQREAHEKVYETFAFLTAVVIMHVFEDVPLSEIARAKGRKVSEVRRAWRQARAILREHL